MQICLQIPNTNKHSSVRPMCFPTVTTLLLQRVVHGNFLPIQICPLYKSPELFLLDSFRSIKHKYKSFPLNEVGQKQALYLNRPLVRRLSKEHLLLLNNYPSGPFRALPLSTPRLYSSLKVSANSFTALDKDLIYFCKPAISLPSKSGHNISA